MWLISTPRMTAPANCTSVCLLAQRLACCYQKSDLALTTIYFHPHSASPLPPHDSRFSSSFHLRWPYHAKDGDISAVTRPQSAMLYLIEFCSTANKEEQVTWCILTNISWGDATLRHWGLKGMSGISVLLDELLKVSLGPNLLKASFSSGPPSKMAIWFVRW